MKNIAVYITGHGYGHAVRTCMVLRELAKRDPFLFFHIRTTAPEWFFSLNLRNNFACYRQYNDVGVVQDNCFDVDKQQTLVALKKLLRSRRSFIEQELEFFRSRDIQLVFADIPPLAFAAAHAADIPAVGMSNFSWDWIYRSYLDTHPEFEPVIRLIRQCYGRAACLLRLPMHGDMDAFPRYLNLPLVTRAAHRKRKDILRLLRIPLDDRKLILVALRAEDRARVNFMHLAEPENYRYLILGEQDPFPGLVNFPQNVLPFEELIHAADVVVSKPGYGIVSECIAARTPLLYTSRHGFPEYEKLVEGIKRYAKSSQFIRQEKFFAGEWQPQLKRALNLPWEGERLAMNGAEVAAEFLLKVIRRGEQLQLAFENEPERLTATKDRHGQTA